MKRIYLDYAATTPVDKRVLKEMLPYFSQRFENSSSIYSGGLISHAQINDSREVVAKFLNCNTGEIIFTSGGTESDNLAVFGVAQIFKKGHIITTSIEHPAVFEAVKKLEEDGFEVTYLKPSGDGIISADKVKKALKSNTILVSIMYANNEIGTIQPIKEISKVIRNFKMSKSKAQMSRLHQLKPSVCLSEVATTLQAGRQANKIQSSKSKKLELAAKYPLLHTDACQATLYLDMNVENLGVDLLTLNGSKIYGPKGIGVLYKREGIDIVPQMVGGEQEGGYRAGTENIASIVGLASAIQLISKKESQKEAAMRDYLVKSLKKIGITSFNGSLTKRLPNNINFSIDGVEGESVLLDLDKKGVEVSTGSACSSRSLLPSRVIAEIANDKIAHESIRVTLGRFTTKGEIDIFLKVLAQTIKRFQEMSPYV